MKRKYLITRSLMAVASFIACRGEVPSNGIVHVRLARSTKQLDKVVRFYREGLGFPVIGGFEGHHGYDGVMLGMPGANRHLEFTRALAGHTLPKPDPENLLVLYYKDPKKLRETADRLQTLGYPETKPENPYWIGKSVTVQDPDGYRIVLFNGEFTQGSEPIPKQFSGTATNEKL